MQKLNANAPISQQPNAPADGPSDKKPSELAGKPGSIQGKVEEHIGWGAPGFHVKVGAKEVYIPTSALTADQVEGMRRSQARGQDVYAQGKFNENGFLEPTVLRFSASHILDIR